MTKNDGGDEARRLIEKTARQAYDNLSIPNVSRVTSSIVIEGALYMLTLKRICEEERAK